jgi:antirestriction protein ArdC
VETGDDAQTIPFLKRFTVFNTDQCDGLPDDVAKVVLPPPPEMIKPEARTLIAATGADFRIGGARAFYNPSADFVQVPPPQAYFEPPSVRSATGPAMRPASTATIRDHFGSKSYARKQLVAELAGGLRLRVNRYRANRSSADYIGSWLVLKSDKRRIFNAASHAQRAVDFLFGLQPNATAQSNVA